MGALVIVSHASVNRPHRRAYDVLAERYGWEVHVVAPASLPVGRGGIKHCDPAPVEARYRLHPLPARRAHSARLTTYPGLAGLCRRVRPDVVFVEYDPGSVAVLEAWAASRLSRARVVAYTVENIPDSRWERASVALRERRAREAVRDGGVGALRSAGRRTIAGLACLNDDGLRIYRDLWGWRMPIDVVPLGTDLGLFHPARDPQRRASLGFAEGDFVVGYFGRLIPEKGVHLLVEALPRLPANARLLLDMFANFVPGDYASRLLARAEELGVRHRIVTIDVPHGEVPRYMNCCDAVALASTETATFKEQFGRVLPEAMACGVPVVCTDTGYLPTIVGDAGLVIPRDSVAALAEALAGLAADPVRAATLAAAGLARVRERWSVEVQSAKLDALFRAVS